MRIAKQIVLGMVLILTVIGVWKLADSATPGQVQMCSIPLAAGAPYGQCAMAKGKIVCGPQRASDPIRTQVSGVQVFQPFSALLANAAVVNCATGQWSTLALVGAQVPATPVSPAPPPAAGPVKDYMVSWPVLPDHWLASHSADGGATWEAPVAVTASGTSVTFKALPAGIVQCFKVVAVDGSGHVSEATQECVAPQPISVQ